TNARGPSPAWRARSAGRSAVRAATCAGVSRARARGAASASTTDHPDRCLSRLRETRRTQEMSATKNQWYVWVVLCGEDHGFGACYDGLWGRERRVYRTRSEACARRDALLNAGCWVDSETG